jgi:chromosome partitioning protein
LPVRVIAWCSEKGGTAKTTSAVNVAFALARAGSRVLVVDLDPQANASLVLLGGEPATPPTIGAVLLEDADAIAAIRPTATPNLDILPSDATLADAMDELAAGQIGREARLRAAVEGLDYDYVMIDTPPTRGLLTINALVAASEVMIPVEPSLFSLAGLGQIQDAVGKVRRYLGNTRLRIAGVLLTRVRNDNVAREVEVQLREAFGPLVLTATVPTSVKIEEAHSRYVSVIEHAPRSPGAKSYLAVAEEIANGGQQEERAGERAVASVPADDRGRAETAA